MVLVGLGPGPQAKRGWSHGRIVGSEPKAQLGLGVRVPYNKVDERPQKTQMEIYWMNQEFIGM